MNYEAAMFVTPHRSSFGSLNLCPTTKTDNTATSQTANIGYHLSNDISVYCNSSVATKVTSSACTSIDQTNFNANTFAKTCILEMPPTRQFSFTASYPVTHRFSSNSTPFVQQTAAYSDNTLIPPLPAEYLVDMDIVYTFAHSPEVENVENSFADKRLSGGDSLPNAFSRTFFFGAMDYKGIGGNATAAPGNQVPASTPYMTPTVVLDKHILKSVRLVQQSPYQQYWPNAQKDIESVLANFVPLQINWDFSSIDGSSTTQDLKEQKISLQPGVFYTLSATVQMQPYYVDDIWAFFKSFFSMDPYYIKEWKVSVISTSVQKGTMNYLNQNEMRVRYVISFVNSVGTV